MKMKMKMKIKKKRSRTMIFSSFVFIVFLIAVLYFKFLNFENTFDEKIIFEIEKGMSLNRIAEEMVRVGAAHDLYSAKIFLRIKSYLKTLHYGEYEVLPREKLGDLIKRILEGKVYMRRIMIPSGLTNKDIFKIIDENEFLVGSVDKFDVLEGMIFSDTYLYRKGDLRQKLVNKMTISTVKNLWNMWLARDLNLPFKSMFEVLILASIIEKEAVYFDDKRKVASVFINRLKDGEKLQSDPTVQYHVEFYHDKSTRLQKSFFTLPSFYSTYYVTSLPLSAISNPSLSSINATLHPDNTNYKYFISMPNDLRLFFSKTYSEHLEYVNKMYKLRRELKISR